MILKEHGWVEHGGDTRRAGRNSLHQRNGRPKREKGQIYIDVIDFSMASDFSMAGQNVKENINLVLVVDGDLSLAFGASHGMKVVLAQGGSGGGSGSGSGGSGGSGGGGTKIVRI